MTMGTMSGSEQKPLWLEIEGGIKSLTDADLQAGSWEASVKKIAGELDDKGFNASKTGGHLLQLRWAMEARRDVGHPLLDDLNSALDALTLDDVANAHAATMGIVRKLGESWDLAKKAEVIGDIGRMVEATRLALLIDRAKGMEGDKGIRYLREVKVADADILEGMGISQEKLAEVDAAMAAEKAERERVKGLLEGVADKPEQDRIKHLLNSDVAEDLIVEIAGVSESAIDDTKKAMEEEIREKERLAAEAAARKKAEAEGPALEDIEPDDMLQYIEEIREILEFSDQEKEIRVMCEQSSIPKALADIAVSDPDKLDELEEKAEADS
jgi:hypothetical protein